ncbi:uncharacterized protein J3D65DRAFT_310800 [Phyllosticta citribraziliensis]|uniref:Uncharacterized protein n=1 Tax=Phyllosticta citribraziliensis TaxID=989973 RepID=A0ABR1LY31_9PEZI
MGRGKRRRRREIEGVQEWRLQSIGQGLLTFILPPCLRSRVSSAPYWLAMPSPLTCRNFCSRNACIEPRFRDHVQMTSFWQQHRYRAMMGAPSLPSKLNDQRQMQHPQSHPHPRTHENQTKNESWRPLPWATTATTSSHGRTATAGMTETTNDKASTAAATRGGANADDAGQRVEEEEEVEEVVLAAELVEMEMQMHGHDVCAATAAIALGREKGGYLDVYGC